MIRLTNVLRAQFINTRTIKSSTIIALEVLPCDEKRFCKSVSQRVLCTFVAFGIHSLWYCIFEYVVGTLLD